MARVNDSLVSTIGWYRCNVQGIGLRIRREIALARLERKRAGLGFA
jgi:hypothetical protein